MRSLLVVPAIDPAALSAALDSGADVVIVDLAAAPALRGAARAAAAEFVAAHAPRAERPRLAVRVGGYATGTTDADLDAAVAAGIDAILLPGACGGMDLTRLDAKIAVAEAVHDVPEGRTRILASATDTAQAVFQAGGCRGATRRLVGLTWAPAGLAESLGIGPYDEDGALLDTFRLARATTLLAAAAAGVAAIDAPFGDVGDLDGLAAACRTALGDGFSAKLAIHPDQVAAINAAFTPDAAAIAAAERVVAGFASAGTAGGIFVDGVFLDRGRLAAAERVLARAGLRRPWISG